MYSWSGKPFFKQMSLEDHFFLAEALVKAFIFQWCCLGLLCRLLLQSIIPTTMRAVDAQKPRCSVFTFPIPRSKFHVQHRLWLRQRATCLSHQNLGRCVDDSELLYSLLLSLYSISRFLNRKVDVGTRAAAGTTAHWQLDPG